MELGPSASAGAPPLHLVLTTTPTKKLKEFVAFLKRAAVQKMEYQRACKIYDAGMEVLSARAYDFLIEDEGFLEAFASFIKGQRSHLDDIDHPEITLLSVLFKNLPTMDYRDIHRAFHKGYGALTELGVCEENETGQFALIFFDFLQKYDEELGELATAGYDTVLQVLPLKLRVLVKLTLLADCAPESKDEAVECLAAIQEVMQEPHVELNATWDEKMVGELEGNAINAYTGFLARIAPFLPNAATDALVEITYAIPAEQEAFSNWVCLRYYAAVFRSGVELDIPRYSQAGYQILEEKKEYLKRSDEYQFVYSFLLWCLQQETLDSSEYMPKIMEACSPLAELHIWMYLLDTKGAMDKAYPEMASFYVEARVDELLTKIPDALEREGEEINRVINKGWLKG